MHDAKKDAETTAKLIKLMSNKLKETK